MRKDKCDETPASPDPSVSPDSECQIIPIIIPMERSSDVEKRSNKQKNNSEIVTLTERTNNITITLDSSSSDEITFNEWDMLEESERYTSKTKSNRWKSVTASSHDVATAAKLVSSNLPQKSSDTRAYSLGSRNIPTVPVPSLGGSRRLSSVLERNKLNLNITNLPRPESPVNVPDVRLSPDPEIFPRSPRNTASPRSKDNHNLPKTPTKPSIPLLVSPPPTFTEPPLSMEDLAELLSEGGDAEKGEKTDDNSAKHKKNSGKPETNLAKDGKGSKSSLPSNVEKESDKRWEDVDIYIDNVAKGKSVSNTIESSRSGEIRSTPHMSSVGCRSPRYADNYERHPRQRDAHGPESAKAPTVSNNNTSCRVPDEEPSQIQILTTTSGTDERPMYHRRINIPLDGRMDVTFPRSDGEFVIEGTDYYNMHMNNRHWPSTAAAEHQNQFSNPQWTPTNAYGGMTNQSPLQPPHPYQHPMNMYQGTNPVEPHLAESQLRQNQYPPGMPVGPRPMLNPVPRPQDMNHVARPEHMREDISLMSNTFPVGPQWGFQMNQGSYDSGFDRSVNPHMRTWDGTANRAGETAYSGENIPSVIGVMENSTGTQYPRTGTPWPRDRANRGRGREAYFNERNRTEGRPGFNRDARRPPDWSRESQADRENLNRFNRDNRSVSERDPRVRTEHNATVPNQAKEHNTMISNQAKSGGSSIRDPRLAKDKNLSPTKAKDVTHNDRDPRKRLAVVSPIIPLTKKINNKDKPKLQKVLEKRINSESSKKKDKSMDRMQSPLESLYSTTNTKPSLQTFKIPKIKRPEPPSQPSSSTTSHVDGTKETEKVSKPPRNKNNSKKSSGSHVKNSNRDDRVAEVSSSSNVYDITEDSDVRISIDTRQDNVTKEEEVLSTSRNKETKKNKAKIDAVNSTTIGSNDVIEKKQKNKVAKNSKPAGEVTQEWIEALIRKSFEFGEGKKLVKHANLIRKLGKVLKARKFKKIQKIFESESDSSSDKEEQILEPKKTQIRKRRVIVSDSSDDECLAERLEILNTGSNDEKTESISVTSTATADSTKHSSEEKISTIISNSSIKKLGRNVQKNHGLSKDVNEDNSQLCDSKKNKVAQLKKTDETSNVSTKNCNDNKNQKNDNLLGSSHAKKIDDRLEDSEKTDDRSEHDKEIDNRLEDRNKNKEQGNVDRSSPEKAVDSMEQSSDQNKDETNVMEFVTGNTMDSVANEDSADKPKATRTKRRNSLEMLQEDIREMFISEDVISATGHRLCRLSKENQVYDSTGTNSKSNASEPSSEVLNELGSSVPSKSKKTSKSRGESNKSKIKDRKNNQRMTRNLRSKELVPSSDSEEDQPLSMRTDWNNAINNIPSREEDRNEESNDTLRRSKRLLKETTKEARVMVEKTDISKLESSKVMFDSSSDESFSIDVAELAAAVESSLQPDKQSDEESVATTASPKPRRKTGRKINKRNLKSRKNASLLMDDKSEDGMSQTDEESVISDISMSSSTTARKRITSSAARTCTREELLSNILVGLVPRRQKNVPTDKGDEADVDEDANDQSFSENAKKSTTRKKKKKSSWKMGIVKKKKRKKKITLASSSKTDQAERDETNSETNVTTNTMETDPLNLEISNIKPEITSENSADDQSISNVNTESIVKYEEIVQPIKMDTCDDIPEDEKKSTDDLEPSGILSPTGETAYNDSELSFDNDELFVKMELEMKNMENADAAKSIDTTEISKESQSTIVYDERMEEIFASMDIKELIKYSWGSQHRCLLCLFMGKNIVHHYKMNHPDREVLIARLKLLDATAAIYDAENSETAIPPAVTPKTVYKYRCRFCGYFAMGLANATMKTFYEHCTTHTGEYRYHCNSCVYESVAKSSMRWHYNKNTLSCRKPNDSFDESTSEDVIPEGNSVYGYLCCDCNFVQLKLQNVKHHVEFWHRNKTTTKILKINMSTVIPENVTSDISKDLQNSTDSQQAFVEKIKPEVSNVEEHKEDLSIKIEMEPILQTTDTDTSKCQDKDANITEEYRALQESQIKEDTVIKQEIDERSRTLSGELEGPTSTTGNLNVFVCSKELENNEDEIQLERKKKMQEIANNIGINLNKNLSKPGLSIIDKLQDKMRTDMISSIECNESANVAEERENYSSPLADAIDDSLKLDDSIDIKEGIVSQSIESVIDQGDSSSTKYLTTDSSEMANNETADKLEVKIRDPLAIMDSNKKSESDGEISDNEAVQRSSVFESESSSESDSEPTDVNKILKETSNINTSSSRDPMLTTIQRLAAQLQSAKPLEMPTTDNIKSEPASTTPESPNASISKLKHLLTKSEAKQCEITPMQRKDGSPPKNFIRLRRLSGDMLSIPALLPDNQEDTRASSTGRCLKRDLSRFSIRFSRDFSINVFKRYTKCVFRNKCRIYFFIYIIETHTHTNLNKSNTVKLHVREHCMNLLRMCIYYF